MLLRYVLFALIPFIASAAHALDSGECGAPEGMNAKLKAEGQRTVASADRLTEDKAIFGWFFTMNADRSVGYILQSDEPTGTRGSKFCVWTRMANMRLFDARQSGRDAAAHLKASDADALRRCDELARDKKVKRGNCASLNTMLKKSAAFGHNVILQGFVVEKQPDGSYHPTDTLATVAGRIDGKLSDFPDQPGMSIGGVLLYSSLPDGASIMNAAIIYPEYTPHGLSLLDKP